MTPRGWLFVGALLAAAAVGLGAYRAHGLEQRLVTDGVAADELPKRLENFQTAVHYQMNHALGLLLVGLLVARRPARALQIGGLAFLVGIFLFSGCLYLLAFTGRQIHWALIPAGGLSFIVGWLSIAFGSLMSGDK
jgi:uncharacterized membrane protein YgdD (TMEM256/DUF423 family)